MESNTSVLPIYSAESQELTWFDFQTGLAELNNLQPRPCPATSAFDFESENVGAPFVSCCDGEIVIPLSPDVGILDLQSIADRMSDFIASVPLIPERIASALRYYCKRDCKIVRHHLVLFAGKPFLIPQSTQEAINALVRDDIDRFQTIALAREHSPLNTLRVIQSLTKFCRERLSKWLSRSRYLQNSSSWVAEYAISANLSASFGLG